MNRSILITRPDSDRTTRYISFWASKTKELAKGKGDKVLDLNGNKAKRATLESYVKKCQPSFLFLNGHGGDDCIAGQDNEILVKAGMNEKIFQSKIIYSLSCRSAKVLGRKSIEAGAMSYIGYEEDFIFLYDDQHRTKIAEDKTAELFLEPAIQVANSLIKENSAGESHKKSKQAFAHNIRKLLSSQATILEGHAVRYLVWNLQNQICLGNVNAKI